MISENRAPSSPPASKPLEDYALIGDCRGAGLVARDGSIDWLCLPRFDSNACFAALLGDADRGCWQIRPAGAFRTESRSYRENTLVLETVFETDGGRACVVDFMPPLAEHPFVIRKISGLSGSVEMESLARFRPDYGAARPWVRETRDGYAAITGPEMYHLVSSVPMESADGDIRSGFTIGRNEERYFCMRFEDSHHPLDEEFRIEPEKSLQRTVRWWRDWVSKSTVPERWREAVTRSLITLKALTYAPSGGIVAAPTTSLPEDPGGVRNWDYRYCWIRDASLLLQSLIKTGYLEEAAQWHDWLLRAIAGEPEEAQIMYGPAGERRLPEEKLSWLSGYDNSTPVRVGNNAYSQLQLDIYGEMMAVYYFSAKAGLPTDRFEWDFLLSVMSFVEKAWTKKDEGIWEVRGKNNHFTYSKFMCWAAFEYGLRAARELGLEAPVKKWEKLRKEIHNDICRNAFNPDIGAFTQAYGSTCLDASVLRMVTEGFLPPSDERLIGTIRAIEEHLINGELVFRYYPSHEVDGLPGAEGAFLLCSFWLADAYLVCGRRKDAEAMFERLLSLRNDVGLLAEEYDLQAKRQVGNFPQGFSHTGLIFTALALEGNAG